MIFAAGLTRKAAPSTCTKPSHYPRRSQKHPRGTIGTSIVYGIAGGGIKCCRRPVHPGSRRSGAVRRTSGNGVFGTQRTLLFAVPVAFFLGGTFVVRLLALGQADFDLDVVAFPVHGGRYQRVTLALDSADQFVDLTSIEQQFAGAPVVGDDMAGSADEWRNGGAEKVDLAAFDQRVA